MNLFTSDLPLHPALVHLPLGIAVLMPLLVGALLVGRRWLPPAAVGLAAGAQALVLGGALLAQETGERDEERVEEAGVSEAAIEAHEELAEGFTGLAGATLLALVGATVLGRRAAATPVLGVAVALAGLTLGQGVRVGHAGGALVYGAAGGAVAGGGEGGEGEALAGSAGGEEEIGEGAQGEGPGAGGEGREREEDGDRD